ncbi:hypothetical protein [Microbulbifer celer]|uniref:hypothetical protein n=1 Tax=Microbulbifer celer TaxID=435905 RepID=UPI00366D1EBB
MFTLKSCRCLVAAMLGLCSQAGAQTVPVSDATLLNSWWIDGSEGLDISGLSFCNGELLAVADKFSDRYYRLLPQNGQEQVPLVQRTLFAPPDLPRDQPVSLKTRAIHYANFQGRMDFEGITCDEDGVYLLSERHNRLVTFSGSGERYSGETLRGRWLPQRWSESARANGYLQKFNGESEGVVKVGGDFWIALEREPRGLLHLRDGDIEGSEYHDLPGAGLDFYGRSEDVTGLAFYRGGLYTLERNAYAVCRRSFDNLTAQWCIRYRHVEESPEKAYLERTYAKAEGLAINDAGIFIVLDNNGVGRVSAPDDRRGLLMQLAHPE